MKKIKRRALPKRKSSIARRGKRFKGVIDAGTVYGVLLLAIILGGAYLMLGNIAPSITSPDQNQQVLIKKPADSSTHSDLQLKDFAAITLTPSPTPTATPTPTPTTPPINTGGGNGGGNHAPGPGPGGGGSGGSAG